MKLELKHIAPYLPYGLKGQFEGIINGKEISSYDKDFRKNNPTNEGWHFNYKPVEQIKGLKVGEIKKVEIYKNYWLIRAGKYTGGLKSFYNGIGFKPILRPLYDLLDTNIAKEINGISSFVFVYDLRDKTLSIQTEYKQDIELKDMMFAIDILYANHFDVFGLIEQGLAIDKNTLTV